MAGDARARRLGARFVIDDDGVELQVGFQGYVGHVERRGVRDYWTGKFVLLGLRPLRPDQHIIRPRRTGKCGLELRCHRLCAVIDRPAAHDLGAVLAVHQVVFGIRWGGLPQVGGILAQARRLVGCTACPAVRAIRREEGITGARYRRCRARGKRVVGICQIYGTGVDLAGCRPLRGRRIVLMLKGRPYPEVGECPTGW